VEFILLQHSLGDRIGKTGLPGSFVSKLWVAAGVGAAFGWTGKLLMNLRHPIIVAIVSLGLYGVVYFGMATFLHVPEARGTIRKITDFVGRLRSHR
jgi:hypothetical protein